MINFLPVSRRATAAWLAGIVVLAGLVLLPGVNGTFIFDDFGNLKGLAELDRASDSLAYVFDSRSGPLGRPVSMATFWLQSACWPDAPRCFTAVNLGLHLLNGVLLYFVIGGIVRLARREDTRLIALAVTALWLLHPIHASTVFYAVQRMNLLAGTFTLLGLLAYLGARAALLDEREVRAAVHGWLLFPLALVLAAFSKENGLLLVAYVAAIEFVLPPPARRQHSVWRAVFIIIPVVLVLGALVFSWSDYVLRGYTNRLFTFEERLFTQFRVMADYLYAIVAPSGSRIGLFHDYPLSTGLLQPVATLFSLIFLAVLTGLATVFRARAPLLALGWLWFLAGHAMESSVFALEIYFEHRNYLPAAGILLAVVTAGAFLMQHLHSATLRRAGLALLFLFGAYFGILAHLEARLWGSPMRQAVVWATENPESPRAQIYFNNVLFATGQKEAAVRHFEQMALRLDDPLIAWMSWLEARCSFPDIKEPPYGEMHRALKTVPMNIGPTNAISAIVLDKLDGECEAVTPDVLRGLAAALLQNPAFKSKRRQLNVTMARIDALDHNFDRAIARLERLYRETPAADFSLQIAGWHVNAGNATAARQWLEQARADHRRHRADYRGFEEDLAYLEKRLALLIEKQE